MTRLARTSAAVLAVVIAAVVCFFALDSSFRHEYLFYNYLRLFLFYCLLISTELVPLVQLVQALPKKVDLRSRLRDVDAFTDFIQTVSGYDAFFKFLDKEFASESNLK